MSKAATTPQPRPDPAYEEFYGFVQAPFALTPDPRFLYRSESHDDAITLLLQAIRRNEGFIVLTGDIGTGKTTICRALLGQLDKTTFTSLVLNPFVSVDDLLRDVLLDFGVISRDAVRSGRVAAASQHDLISTLHEFLLSLMAIRGSAVLIIDEAQHLSPQVLEQIRIISNLETNESKLLQIVLVGQLNLLDVLAEAELRQLDQRISIRAALKPLTRDEVEAYIAHRLEVARASNPVQFEPEALDLVARFTGGVPRIINLLCDRALMAGASTRVNRITPGLIEDAARTLGLTVPEAVVAEPPPAPPAPPSPLRRFAVPLAAALVVGIALVGFAVNSWTESPQPTLPARPSLMRAQPAEPQAIPSPDLMPPPLPAPPRPVRPGGPGEVPDDQVGLRRPPV